MSESQLLMGSYIKEAFETAFVDDEYHIQVQLNVVEKDFPSIYYDHMMLAEFDLSIGGISGSTLDASSFADTYRSDNQSGFTLNWGIDTSVAEIEISYINNDGVHVCEMWSFDAISSVLNGEVWIEDGEEGTHPSASNFNYTPTTVSFEIDEFDNPNF